MTSKIQHKRTYSTASTKSTKSTASKMFSIHDGNTPILEEVDLPYIILVYHDKSVKSGSNLLKNTDKIINTDCNIDHCKTYLKNMFEMAGIFQFLRF